MDLFLKYTLKFLKNCIELLKNPEQQSMHDNQVPLEELNTYKKFDKDMLHNMVITVWSAMKEDCMKHNRLEGLLKNYQKEYIKNY